MKPKTERSCFKMQRKAEESKVASAGAEVDESEKVAVCADGSHFMVNEVGDHVIFDGGETWPLNRGFDLPYQYSTGHTIRSCTDHANFRMSGKTH